VQTECGAIVEQIWNLLPTQFPDITTHEFIVMPNHIHGIIEIHAHGGRGGDLSRPDINSDISKFDINSDDRDVGDKGVINHAPTPDNKKNGGFAGEKNPMFHDNLSKMVRWFKGRATFECRKVTPHFAWQRNYWEHIIRNEQSYQRIANYIINNPANWKDDKFYEE
jgi:REP element-mobilizing transposase RayT